MEKLASNFYFGREFRKSKGFVALTQKIPAFLASLIQAGIVYMKSLFKVQVKIWMALIVCVSGMLTLHAQEDTGGAGPELKPQAGDSTTVDIPEKPELLVRTEMGPREVTIGEPVFAEITIRWRELPAPLLVVPDLQNLPSWFSVDSIRASQSKTVEKGVKMAQVRYVLRMIPEETGTQTLEPIAFRYRWLGQEFRVLSEARQVTIVPPREVPVQWIGLLVILLLVLLVAGYTIQLSREKKRLKLENLAREKEFEDRFEALEQKVARADDRQWVKDLETFCLDWMRWQARSSSEDFDSLLKKLPTGLKGPEWDKLKEFFYQAHYGGGAGDVFARKKRLQQVRECLQMDQGDAK